MDVFTDFALILLKPYFMTHQVLVRFGIGDWVTFTFVHYLQWRRWLQAFQNSTRSMKELAKVAHWVRILKVHFIVVKVDPNVF